MSIKFSERPGSRERHLRRKYQNPLFKGQPVTADEVLLAQKQDQDDVMSFMESFRALVMRAAELEANADTDLVLALKEQLDKAYEQCAGLAGDHTDILGMLQQLIQAVMGAMWQAVGQDVQARSKLEMEEEARRMHFTMLQHGLIADLLSPDSCIIEDELVPALLSESSEAVRQAMQLFEPDQQAILCRAARDLLDGMEPSLPVVAQAMMRLSEMEAGSQAIN